MDTKRLRQRVLDLAIHGKLVPQNPQDEPASELLKRIAAEKERLIKEGIIRKGNRLPEQEWPYAIPTGWTWCILDDFAYVASGSTPSKDSFVSKGIPYLKMYNLRNQKIDFYYEPQYIKEEVHNGKLQRSRTEVGDLIMNIVGPPLGKLAIIPDYLPQANFNQAAVLIRPVAHKDILVKYLFYYLQEMSEIDSISTKGSAGQVNISLTQSQNMRIPLPPLAEQHRIVSEVEKYFSLIDILEESENDLQQSIQKAKSKILDLAIKGKLVEKTGEWEDKKLGDICNYGKCITVNVEDIAPDSWVLELEDIEKDTARIQNRISRQERDIKGTRHSFKKGDILYSKLRTYLNKVLVAKEDGFCTTEIIPIKPNECITAEFLCHVMRSKYFVDYTVQCGYGVKMPRLSTTDAKKAIIPLPPLEEQHRIVAKIEELFTQLDNIAEALK